MIFSLHILRPTLSTNMIQRVLQWEMQKRCSSRKKVGGSWHINIIIINFLMKEEMKMTKDKRMVKLEFCFCFFKTTLFEHILKKSAHSFVGAWSFHLVHIRFTPSKGPKGIALIL
jgi:hypothetical protein